MKADPVTSPSSLESKLANTSRLPFLTGFSFNFSSTLSYGSTFLNIKMNRSILVQMRCLT